jgi:hypothetical protein
MSKANRVLGTPRTTASEFLTTVSRIRLSQMIRDPFVSAAFRAAEDDGLDPDMAEFDHPKHLDGGAAEVIGETGRHIRALVEG